MSVSATKNLPYNYENLTLIVPPSPARAISDAHAVCKALDQGHSPQDVVDAVAKVTGLSAKGAKTFSVDAATAYCPQYVTSS